MLPRGEDWETVFVPKIDDSLILQLLRSPGPLILTLNFKGISDKYGDE